MAEIDIIRIDRLIEYFDDDTWTWNKNEIISLDDITNAVNQHIPIETTPFGDQYEHIPLQQQSTDWHIRRVLYFIKYPDEIKNIDIDNYCMNNHICAIPVIVDGNHRLMAAKWLYQHHKLSTIPCKYSGRIDLLDYLTGQSDIKPIE